MFISSSYDFLLASLILFEVEGKLHIQKQYMTNYLQLGK